MARNTLDFSSTFQQHHPTAIIMPSSFAYLFPQTIHHHHHYPLTSTKSCSFFTIQLLHFPQAKQEKSHKRRRRRRKRIKGFTREKKT
uniref:Uncharacterized protein n=1 Tax=Manihot esculenta TaxID=3983 RepID=A0A2C9UKK1_MANES